MFVQLIAIQWHKVKLTFDLIVAEPWNDDAVMYQPYEVEQILLAENASCLAAKAFLNVNW